MKNTSSSRKNWLSYLGSVWVRPSLEVDDAIGVTGARLCVFFHRPLLHCRHGQAGVFTQLHVWVLRGQAGSEANMLPDQPPTAAPWRWIISLWIYTTYSSLFIFAVNGKQTVFIWRFSNLSTTQNIWQHMSAFTQSHTNSKVASLQRADLLIRNSYTHEMRSLPLSISVWN